MTEIGYQKGVIAGWAGLLEEVAETNPDLIWPQSLNVFDRMRREDPQVMSMMRAVTLPMQESDWRLDATGVRDEVVELVANDLNLGIVGRERVAPLRTKGRFSWDEFLRLAMLELVYGHSVFEQVYIIDEQGRTRLSKLAWRPPRTITDFQIEKDGGLKAIVQRDAPQPIPVDRLVVFVNEREGANWIGVSLFRAAYKVWLLKDRTLRVQALAAERNGLGLPVYTSAPPPEDSDPTVVKKWLDDEIAAGMKIAKGARAGETAGASLPHGATFRFEGVTGKVPDLDKQIRYYDEQIARTVLANFLNLGGDNSTGSYALGDTFESFFSKSLNGLARHIASTIQQHVIEDLVDKNWGPTEPAPRLVPPRIGAEHPATAEAMRALLESGAIHWDPKLEAHLRTQYGLPVMEPVVDGAAPNGETEAERARFAAETVQKVYLATDKPVLNQAEARDIVRRAGAVLSGDPPAPDPAPEEAAA